MLLDKLQADLIVGLKSRDQMRTNTIRFLISDIKKYAIDTYLPGSKQGLTDDDVIKIIRRQIKNRKESIAAFTKGGRQDLADKETSELKILETYVPAGAGAEEIRKIVKSVMVSGETDFGKIMGQVMKKLQGQADGATVAKIVKEEIAK